MDYYYKLPRYPKVGEYLLRKDKKTNRISILQITGYTKKYGGYAECNANLILHTYNDYTIKICIAFSGVQIITKNYKRNISNYVADKILSEEEVIAHLL